MTRRGWGLLGGGVVTLLLAAWVSATGPVAIFARRDLTDSGARARGIDYGVDSGTSEGQKLSSLSPSAAQPFLVDLVSWAAKVLLALVALALLVAVVRELRRWWAAREAPQQDLDDAVVVPEVLLRGAREGEELLATGSPANAVVAAWVALESAVRSIGVRDDATRTSEELVTAVLRSYAVDRSPLDALAALYREARFSTHPIGEEMRDRAREALQQVQVELRRATPKVQHPETSSGATSRSAAGRSR
ncbi:hypothetical protein GCM10009867_30310 [Pedococcus aerophilus]|uniref:Protein-glutamine gamma-glutamyltransferase-like C-terminal domain-containing protein n=1 Tax=Pedococcus aerophilus TaxID=436356 RepID=A0ABN3UU50_9MICO